MRKFLVSLAAAGTALAFATPATAQYFPQYGYNQYANPYNRYGYNNIAQWQRDLQQIRYAADNLMRSGRLTGFEARDLNRDIWSAQRSLEQVGRYGVQPWEAQQMQQRLLRLRYELRRYSDYDYRNGNRWGGYNGYNGYRYDRDDRDDD